MAVFGGWLHILQTHPPLIPYTIFSQPPPPPPPPTGGAPLHPGAPQIPIRLVRIISAPVRACADAAKDQ